MRLIGLILLSILFVSCGDEINHCSLALETSEFEEVVTTRTSIINGQPRYAQSFTVATDIVLESIEVKMTFTALGSIDLNLYKGGAVPEGGALVFNKSLAAPDDVTEQFVKFTPNTSVTLTKGDTYFISFDGNPNLSEYKTFSVENSVQAGQSWEYSSSTWNAIPDVHLIYKLNGKISGCES